jgi:hypothetical protein
MITSKKIYFLSVILWIVSQVNLTVFTYMIPILILVFLLLVYVTSHSFGTVNFKSRLRTVCYPRDANMADSLVSFILLLSPGS